MWVQIQRERSSGAHKLSPQHLARDIVVGMCAPLAQGPMLYHAQRCPCIQTNCSLGDEGRNPVLGNGFASRAPSCKAQPPGRFNSSESDVTLECFQVYLFQV